jgi:hypothetical protein
MMFYTTPADATQPENLIPLESYLTGFSSPKTALDSLFAGFADEPSIQTIYEKIPNCDQPFGAGEAESDDEPWWDETEAWEYENDRRIEAEQKAREAVLRARPYVKKPISSRLRWRVFRRDGYRCLFCGSLEDLTADHIIAEVNGGPTEFENLQTLCRPCNSKKGAR